MSDSGSKGSGSRPDGTTRQSITYNLFYRWFFLCC